MPDDALDRPIHVTLVVYDLLPEGRLSSLAWVLGCGIYHTTVRIDNLNKEYAFGGHPYPRLTGVFSTPARTDHKPPVPGLRWVKDVDMGEVQLPKLGRKMFDDDGKLSSGGDIGTGEERRSLMKALPRLQLHKGLSPARPRESHDGLTRAAPSNCRGGSAAESEIPNGPHNDFKDEPCPSPIYPPHPIADYSSDSGSSSGSNDTELQNKNDDPSLPSDPHLRFVHRVLRHLEESPEWRGTQYDLLKRNCNTFSSVLCEWLTGKAAPGWINRAAAVGTAFPCLVPQDWIEPPSAPASPSREATTYQGGQVMLA